MMHMKSRKILSRLGALLVLLILTGCNSTSRVLNPFYEEPSPIAFLGEANDHALGGKSSDQGARKALEAAGSYGQAHVPGPNNPVMNPAVVRIMWVPDHLNSHGDLVPAHYYYLKVRNDYWAVKDSFEMEQQLGKSTGSSNIPYAVGK